MSKDIIVNIDIIKIYIIKNNPKFIIISVCVKILYFFKIGINKIIKNKILIYGIIKPIFIAIFKYFVSDIKIF